MKKVDKNKRKTRVVTDAIGDYIKKAPAEVRATLKKIRAVIRKAAPDADEKIAYGMPTFTLHGNLVHFAACKNHLGFYPTPSPIIAFKKELAGYVCTRGAVQIPWVQPLPVGLITKMVKFRIREVLEKKKIR